MSASDHSRTPLGRGSAGGAHLLVIRFSALGDVAMTVPVLRAVVQQNPEVKITVVSRGFFKPIFNGIPHVNFYEADLKGKHKGVMGLYRLSKELKALGIDGVADLHNVLRSKALKIFFRLKGLRVVQQDKGRAEKKALTSGKQFKQLKATHERYADVFRAFGFTVDLSAVKLPSPILSNKAMKFLDKEKKTIGVAPFAAFQGKMYPLPKMEEVIAELNDKDHQVLLFGGPSEKEKLTAIASKYEQVSNIAGKLSFEEELALIANLGLMIAMDSGNAHLAAMFGVPTTTLWGVTHPYAGFYPFGQPIENALLANREQFPEIPTSVYGNKMPDGYEKAIETILPQQVVEKAYQILST